MRELRGHWLLFIAGLVALAGIIWLVAGPEGPTVVNLALFLVLLVPAVAGLTAPLLAWLHRRLPFAGQQTPGVAARQGFLLGLGVALLAWLQLIRLLDPTLALGIVALVVLAEVLMQSRGHQE